MPESAVQNRAARAIMRAFIGDALGGPYGMLWAIYHQLPAAYYLAARFPQDFQSAVLHAATGGGQNEARHFDWGQSEPKPGCRTFPSASSTAWKKAKRSDSSQWTWPRK